LETVLELEGLRGRRYNRLTLHFDWMEAAEAEHFVQFYESDTFLVESVSRFIGTALDAGTGAIVIATPPHRSAIQRKLRARGAPVRGARKGQLVVLDAAETLANSWSAASPTRGGSER